MEHLWGKWCKVKTAKHTYALANFHQIWELYKHIDTFALSLNKHQILCRKVDVKIKNILKTQFFVEQMIERELFKEDELEEYKLKNAADREWSLTLQYFRTSTNAKILSPLSKPN